MASRTSVSVVFVHGLAKKPAPEKLKEIWLWGLGRDNPNPDVFRAPNKGVNLGVLGVPHYFNYYADVFYGTDYEVELDSYYELKEEGEIEAEALDRTEPDLPWPKAVTPREKRFIRNVEDKLKASPAMVAARPAAKPGKPVKVTVNGEKYEIAAWLPDEVKQAVIKKAAMEAYYYLFNKEYVRPGDGARFMVRQELRGRLLDELKKAAASGGRVVLVTHSMGTIIGYDVLRNCTDCPAVDTFITLGSPLGITEVQDELIAEGAKAVDFPAEKAGRWINVYDPLDPVCGADPKLKNDFKVVKGRSVQDVKESNWGSWRHTITHYFAGTLLRKHLLQAIS